MKLILMRGWLQAQIGHALNIAPEKIEPGRSLFEFGVSSKDAVRLAGRIEERFAIEVEATITYDFSTVDELAAELLRRNPRIDF